MSTNLMVGREVVTTERLEAIRRPKVIIEGPSYQELFDHFRLGHVCEIFRMVGFLTEDENERGDPFRRFYFRCMIVGISRPLDGPERIGKWWTLRALHLESLAKWARFLNISYCPETQEGTVQIEINPEQS